MMLLLSAAWAAVPHFSYPKWVSANGWGAVVWNDDRLGDAYPHLYQEYAPGVVTPDLLWDSYFGLVDADGGRWLLDWDEVRYRPGTNLIHAEGSAGPYTLVLDAWTPMEAGGFGLAQVLQVTNAGGDARAVQVVSLQNWHVGGTEVASSPSAEEVVEAGTDATLAMYAPGATDAACAGVWDTVNAGGEIGGGCTQSGADVVPAFGWRVELGAGETRSFGVYAGVDVGWADADPSGWVAAEEAWWSAWHAGNQLPTDLSDDRRAVALQSLAFLKMAQVVEPGDAHGQIPASLPLSAPVGDFQHIWNITWVRDGAYATVALARTGHAAEAAAMLRFLIQPGKTGEYRSYVGGLDYAVSVCRVYGDGTEWSDSDANGPNVEYDNFGLYLWALGQVIAAGETGLVEELGPRALDGVADVLVRLQDPVTGLLQPDSSIWERHWNGQQQQFTYSSVWAAEGLEAAATIADALGDPRGDEYRAVAASIEEAIVRELVDAGGVLAASREQLESGSDYLDLATVEAFNTGAIAVDDPIFGASMEAWDRLRVASGGGYMRNDDGDTYDSHEWAMIDLRTSAALRRAGEVDEAEALLDWITDHARLNSDVVPELYDPDTADYAGPAPMLGFGAGAYLLTLADAEDPDFGQEPEPEDPVVQQLGPCGCGPAGAPVGLVAPALSLLLALRRRR